MKSLDEQDLWYATDDKAEYEAMIGLREARKKLQHATTSRRFCKKSDNSRESVAPDRSKSIQELEKVKTCHRCGALDYWEDECPGKGHRRRSSPSDRSSGRCGKQSLKSEVTEMQGQKKRSNGQD